MENLANFDISPWCSDEPEELHKGLSYFPSKFNYKSSKKNLENFLKNKEKKHLFPGFFFQFFTIQRWFSFRKYTKLKFDEKSAEITKFKFEK